MTQDQLAHYRARLQQDWDHSKQQLLAALTTLLQHAQAALIAQCKDEELLDNIPNSHPQCQPFIQRLTQIEAAFCQMELGLYGLCSDCEEPLSQDLLAHDPAQQRCLRCELRYQQGFHSHEL